jgi:hypothetical protein
MSFDSAETSYGVMSGLCKQPISIRYAFSFFANIVNLKSALLILWNEGDL